MRYGLISDIHANLHALDTALAALRREGVDGFLCMGDLVGYGPFPNECVERVAELGARCVAAQSQPGHWHTGSPVVCRRSWPGLTRMRSKMGEFSFMDRSLCGLRHLRRKLCGDDYFFRRRNDRS